MRQRRNAFIGALVWWFGTRWVRRRAARAVSSVPGVGSGGGDHGRLRNVAGGLALVAAFVTGLIAWRKLRGPGEPDYPSAARAQTDPTGGDTGDA